MRYETFSPFYTNAAGRADACVPPARRPGAGRSRRTSGAERAVRARTHAVRTMSTKPALVWPLAYSRASRRSRRLESANPYGSAPSTRCADAPMRRCSDAPMRMCAPGGAVLTHRHCSCIACQPPAAATRWSSASQLTISSHLVSRLAHSSRIDTTARRDGGSVPMPASVIVLPIPGRQIHVTGATTGRWRMPL